jgi:hypothetical protein
VYEFSGILSNYSIPLSTVTYGEPQHLNSSTEEGQGWGKEDRKKDGEEDH